MATVTGFVEKIKYHNDNNGYSVISVVSDDEEYVLVGTFNFIAEGELIEATGTMTEHPVYGEQLSVESYELKSPENIDAIERYLGSGAIKGIGTALAGRIVRRFKADTFRIIEEEPERLSEVKGVSEKMARSIGEQVEEKKEMRHAMMFLQDYGISMNLAVKIYQEYGSRVYDVIKENPYRMADDIPGVGFKIADEIASKVGIFTDSDFRIKSGILYTLLQGTSNGNTYLPEPELLKQASELLGVSPEHMQKHIMDMQIDKHIIVKESNSSSVVYSSQYYYMELNTAKMLHDLNIQGSTQEKEIKKNLDEIQKKEGIELDILQAKAVIEAVNSGLLIITGGPGTGKTTTINTIIRYFEQEDMDIELAAPTGRAAKRMTETTGREARTIHRMLELNGAVEDNRSGMHFEKNEENPLDADVIIIDEVSMVDIHLMNALLKAVNVGTRLILVGDINQLPSVGPGNVLKDIIQSECFNVVKLTRIFRQAAESDIIVNAHKINDGEPVDLSKKSRDFLFIKRDTPDTIVSAVLTLIKDKLPEYVHAQPSDIQVMTPMRKGALGVERLNTILQKYLNPPSNDKAEKEIGGTVFRVGDKVMQIKNNYQTEWEIRSRYGIPVDRGNGIFNGDTGIVRDINFYAEQITVEYDEGKLVEYSFKQTEELELAYAITIHKSQGSEYPAVIIPIHSGPKMLFTRNLIYTAVTRAKSCVCLVGLPEMFKEMAANETEQKRYTGLCERIKEIENTQGGI